MVYNCEQIEEYPERYKSPREVELDRRRAENLPLNLSYADLGEFLDPFYQTYRCADGPPCAGAVGTSDGEMRHRVKNLFALASAIVSITTRASGSVDDVYGLFNLD